MGRFACVSVQARCALPSKWIPQFVLMMLAIMEHTRRHTHLAHRAPFSSACRHTLITSAYDVAVVSLRPLQVGSYNGASAAPLRRFEFGRLRNNVSMAHVLSTARVSFDLYRSSTLRSHTIITLARAATEKHMRGKGGGHGGHTSPQLREAGEAIGFEWLA